MAKIFIGLGTNIDRERAALQGLEALKEAFTSIKVSRLYESQAIGFTGNNFYNAVISAETDLSLIQVLNILKNIESQYAHSEQQAGICSKRLDLDMLLYDNVVTAAPIQLPRPEILYNAYVLLPLSEVAPDLKHPTTGKTYQQHWQQYTDTTQKLWPVEATYKDWFS